MSETTIQRRIQLNLSDLTTRLWRNNVGAAWQGRAEHVGNVVTLYGPRRVEYGLCPGSSDLIGLRSVEITPDMVGQRVAIFCAVEVKTATGRPTPEQTAFIKTVTYLGGRAGIARSEDEAKIIVDGGNR
jgi:hypothetical protein